MDMNLLTPHELFQLVDHKNLIKFLDHKEPVNINLSPKLINGKKLAPEFNNSLISPSVTTHQESILSRQLDQLQSEPMIVNDLTLGPLNKSP